MINNRLCKIILSLLKQKYIVKNGVVKEYLILVKIYKKTQAKISMVGGQVFVTFIVFLLSV